MNGVLFATWPEARPFLSLAGVAEDETPLPAVRKAPGGWIAVSGVGPLAAAEGARALVVRHGCTRLINVGVAGALREDMPVGSIWEASHGAFFEGEDPHWLPCVTGCVVGAGRGRVLTLREPLFSAEKRARLASFAHLVEMEGAACATVAWERGIPCHLVKGVSDQACEGGREVLLANLDRVACSLAAAVWQAWGRP